MRGDGPFDEWSVITSQITHRVRRSFKPVLSDWRHILHLVFSVLPQLKLNTWSSDPTLVPACRKMFSDLVCTSKKKEKKRLSDWIRPLWVESCHDSSCQYRERRWAYPQHSRSQIVFFFFFHPRAFRFEIPTKSSQISSYLRGNTSRR